MSDTLGTDTADGRRPQGTPGAGDAATSVPPAPPRAAAHRRGRARMRLEIAVLSAPAVITFLAFVIFPVALALKVDPIHLGILLTLNIEMGVVTPPVGLNLFAVCSTSKIPLPQVVKGTIPFFAADLVVLLIIIFVPELATWLPDKVVTDAFKQ